MNARDRINETRSPSGTTGEIEIVSGQAILAGDLQVPTGTRGTILFAHGSGSSRHSPRNQFVAGNLNEQGFSTLLLDLLTPEEEARDRDGAEHRFDIDLLTERLLHTIEWIKQEPLLKYLSIGLFGASTGAAAALAAAAQSPQVAAVVSRGGRPDMAGELLEHVQVPVLLIVGSQDRTVLNLNRQALTRFPAGKKLEIIPGATHLFEEPGALEQVSKLAGQWFEQYLTRTGATVRAA